MRTLARQSVIITTVLLFLVADGWAGLGPKSWQIQEIENAPFLVVGTVRDVTARELVPDGMLRWNGLGRYFEAKLLVNRVFSSPSVTAPPLPQPNETITLRYISYDENARCCANGGPEWLRLKTGDVALFPLMPAAPNRWNLVAEEGENIVVPAIADAWQTATPPDTTRAFILHELANALSRGRPADQNAAASYLGGQHEEPAGLRSILEASLGADDDEWLQVATALLTQVVAPGVTATDLMAGRLPTGIWSRTLSSITGWALNKGATRDYPNRLIPALVARGRVDEPLQEFRDSPILDTEMIRALRRGDPDSMRLALNFIRSGKKSFLPEALESAAELAQVPASVPPDDPFSRLVFACKLIIDYGSDVQFNALATSLRNFQTADESQYRSLWRAINGSENKRALRLDAIVITDRRMMDREVRYCDTAAGNISVLSGQIFYARSGASVAERDRGVERAITWLKSNKLL